MFTGKGNEYFSGNDEWSWTNWKSAGSSSWNKDNLYNQEVRGTKAQPDYDPKSTSSSSWKKDKSYCQEAHRTKASPDHSLGKIHWGQDYQQQYRGSQHWYLANLPIQRRNSRFDCSEMRDSCPDTLNYNTVENRSCSLQRDNKDHSRPYVKQNIGQKQSNYPASIPQQGKQWTVPQPL